MALPGDVEDGAIPDDGVSGEISHTLLLSKNCAKQISFYLFKK